MAKKGTILVKLASSAKTGYFYVIRKNPKKIGNKKLSFNKYDPVVMKHVEFVEEKLR